MGYLKACKQRYFDNFYQKEWIEQLSWNSGDPRDPYSEGLKKISDFNDEVFIALAKSLLSGEYIQNTKSVDVVLKRFKNITMHENPLTSSEDSDEISILKERLYRLYDKMDNEIRSCITEYRSLISFVSHKTDTVEHNFVFNTYYAPTEINSNSILAGVVKLIIPVCREDHTLSYTVSSIQNLILLRDTIGSYRKIVLNPEIKDIYNVLYDKASFLLKKMLVFSDAGSEYCLNFTPYSLNASNIKLAFLTRFYERFQHLHTIINDSYEYLHFKMIKNSLTIPEIVLLVRFYQKKDGSLQQINKAIESFETLYQTAISKDLPDKKFNIYALNTVKNYLYNCRLSFKLKNRKYKYEQLINDMDEIIRLQIETRIKNYYPYQKAIDFLFKDITRLLEQENPFNEKDEINNRISTIKYYITKLKDSIRWCKSRYFYPFQLPYEDCLVNYAPLALKVFVPSTYTRPIKYDKIESYLLAKESEITIYQNKLELFEERQEIQDIKDSIAKSERKYIEIFGVFVGIITFLFGTVDFFSNSSSPKDLFLLSTSYGVILLLFVSAVCFLATPRTKNWHDFFRQPRLYFFGISAFLYFVFLLLLVLAHLFVDFFK